jgi:hypothetical protein
MPAVSERGPFFSFFISDLYSSPNNTISDLSESPQFPIHFSKYTTMDSPDREPLILSHIQNALFDQPPGLAFPTPTVPFSDVGSSISRRVGSQPPMSVYDPYAYRTYPRQYPAYGVPTASSYYSYAPSAAYTTGYSTYGDSSRGYSGASHENMYYSYNGKLIRSYRIRSFRVGPFLWSL